MSSEGIAYVLSAPSGTGKSTVCKILRERFPNLRFSVSHTTRPPRPSEVNGSDYHFIGEEEFKSRIERGDFLEWAKVHNNYYGTSSEAVEHTLKEGKDLLLELDVQGAETLRKLKFRGVFIFLLPPSLDELERRLVKRGTEPESKIRQRIETGKKEMMQYRLYDYAVTNHEVENTVHTLSAIFVAEKFRSNRYQPGDGAGSSCCGKGEHS